MAAKLDKKTIMAIVLLAMGLLVAVPQFIPDSEETVIEEGELFDDDDYEDEGQGQGLGLGLDGPEDETALPEGPKVDMIAAFGSWTAKSGISNPFGPVESKVESVLEVVVDEGPAPFPPVHHVSLVLLAGRVPRAVVDQRVVSPGDEIAAGRIVSMSADGIAVESAVFGRLDYDLGVLGARGYGAAPPTEPAADAQAGDADTADDASLELTAEALPVFPRAPAGADDPDPDQLAETADRMLQELYESFGANAPEEDGR